MAAAGIENALVGKLGVSARVFILSAPEVAGIVTENPLLEVADNPSRLFVATLADRADRMKLEPLLQEDWTAGSVGIG